MASAEVATAPGGGPAERYDVVVVGAGPVGQTLAVLLGRRGWHVGVLDRQPVAYPLPRAVHFDGEVARLLQGVGVTDEAGEWTEALDAYEWRNAAGEVLLRLQAEGVAQTSGWPVSTMFSQPDLDRRLAEQVGSEPTVEVHRGWEVTALHPGRTAVAVSVRNVDVSDGGGGGDRRVEASWLVGCDGAASFVREAAGIETEDLGYFFDWLIVDVVPDQPARWTPRNIQVCDPVRPTTAVSGGPGRRRWEFMRLAGETREDLADVATAWRLLQPWAMTPATARIERHAVYTFAAHLATEWRRDRVLLAGDAAHQMPPFAGQGLCSGIRDAANLAWKLDLVLAGHAPPGLLDTYVTERRPGVRATIELSIELGRIICVPDPSEADARDEAMVAAARASGPVPIPPAPPITGGIVAVGDAHAGQAWIQGRVAHAGATGRFDDVVGRGWLLLGPDSDPSTMLREPEAAWFASIGGRTASIGGRTASIRGRTAGVAAGGPIDDIDGTYRDWFDHHRVDAVLVRPDFVVFGAAARRDEVTARQDGPAARKDEVTARQAEGTADDAARRDGATGLVRAARALIEEAG